MIPFWLDPHDIRFPDPRLAEPSDGLLAIGGDLSEERLLTAYRMGIFPWYEEGSPILWWSPAPRLILKPEKIRVSRRLARTIRQSRFTVSVDRDCPAVIDACRESRIKNGEGTWITEEMRDAYVALHGRGHVHSVECRQAGELVGGLYGVAIGGVFCGESMFSLVPDASKVALAALCRILADNGFDFIDCQMRTSHLVRMGAVEVSGKKFRQMLARAVENRTAEQCWPSLAGRELGNILQEP